MKRMSQDPAMKFPAMQDYLNELKQVFDSTAEIEDGTYQFAGFLAQHQCNPGAAQKVVKIAAREEVGQHPVSQPEAVPEGGSTELSKSKKRRLRKQATTARIREREQQMSHGRQ